MRLRLSFGLVSVVLGLATEAQAQAPNCARPELASSRWEEDWSFLENPGCRDDPWDPVKHVAIGRSGASYASFGFELRERYERLDHPDFDRAERDTNGYWLQRIMIHGDLHLGSRFRAFVQLKSGLEEGRAGGPRPPDEDRLDLHQAFVEGEIALGSAGSLSLRAGRQEIALGSSRLVSVREAPNVRRTFDGIRVSWARGDWSTDAFAFSSVETSPGVFDDGREHGEQLWGLYAVGPVVDEKLGVDLYYLGMRRDDAEFDRQTDDERRHSIGARVWGTPGAWDYDFELVAQWGEFGAREITAWTVASDTGFTFSDVPGRPRLALRANVTSGDHDPSDHELTTFDPLFPRGSYFGEASLIGPQNHIDLHPMLELRLRDDWSVTAGWDFFWRESTSDALYRVSGSPLVAGNASGARRVGSQGSLRVDWQAGRHFDAAMVYEHFFAGPFLRDAGLADVDFVALWLSFRV